MVKNCLTIKELATLVGIDRKTIYSARKKRQLEDVADGRSVSIPIESAVKWMREIRNIPQAKIDRFLAEKASRDAEPMETEKIEVSP